ncbi:hypothetical protein CAPI_02600 [Corynebacterium capitovis DSM 44611]|nr:hypothetical protein CAPI_02600 [Corynebacterium capitovis DSM 44611]
MKSPNPTKTRNHTHPTPKQSAHSHAQKTTNPHTTPQNTAVQHKRPATKNTPRESITHHATNHTHHHHNQAAAAHARRHTPHHTTTTKQQHSKTHTAHNQPTNKSTLAHYRVLKHHTHTPPHNLSAAVRAAKEKLTSLRSHRQIRAFAIRFVFRLRFTLSSAPATGCYFRQIPKRLTNSQVTTFFGRMRSRQW